MAKKEIYVVIDYAESGDQWTEEYGPFDTMEEAKAEAKHQRESGTYSYALTQGCADIYFKEITR